MSVLGLIEDLEQHQPSDSLSPVLHRPLIPQGTTKQTSNPTVLAAVKLHRDGIAQSIFFIMNCVAMNLTVRVAPCPCRCGFLGGMEPGLELLGHSMYVGPSPVVNDSFPKELN